MSHHGQQSATSDILQLVCFRVGAEEYGIDIMRVREVVPALPITRVADAPAFLEGVIELRGALFGVVDLRRRLGVTTPAGTAQQRYVVAWMHGRSLGLVVDGVTEVRRIERARVAPLAVAAPGAGRLLAGVARLDDGVVLVMELDHLLTNAEQAALGAA